MLANDNAVLLSLVLSTVGLGIFIYGKRQGRFPHLLCGVTLMVYPYFVSNLLAMAGIAAAIVLGTWIAVRLGA